MPDKIIKAECPVCKGTGSVAIVFAHGMRAHVSRCIKCGGTGTITNTDKRG